MILVKNEFAPGFFLVQKERPETVLAHRPRPHQFNTYTGGDVMAVVSLSEFKARRQSHVQTVHREFRTENPEEILSDFMVHLIAKNGLSKSTADTYRRTVKVVLERLGTTRPSEKDLLRYVAEMHGQKSYGYIGSTGMALEAYTGFLGTPIRFGKPKKPKQEIGEVLTEAEVALLIATGAKNIRQKAILSLLAYSGIRNEELCSLAVSDILFAEARVRVRQGKGGKDRTVKLGGACLPVLMQCLEAHTRSGDDCLFTTLRHGQPLSTTAIRRMVKKCAVRARIGKRVHPHLFRHSLAVHMRQRGADPWDIQMQLGHSDVMTTITTYLRRYRPQDRAKNFEPSYL